VAPHNARGLSGLAKAFFYADSRAVLVSHCPIISDAAVALTTRMLAVAKAGLTRTEAHPEAHRQTMAAMIDNGPAHNAHPALSPRSLSSVKSGFRHAQ